MSIRMPIAALALGLSILAAYGPTRPLAAQDKKPAQPRGELDAKGPRITELLAKRISFDKPFEGPFKEALGLLADRYDLPLVLDPALREVPGAAEAACDGIEDRPVKLPRLMNVRIGTVLRLVCEQADAMYLVYPDYIRIVPTMFGLYETGVIGTGSDAASDEAPTLTADQLLKTRPLTKRAIVNLTFKDTTVAEVLDEIATTSGANVVLAPLVAEKGTAKLSVRFANTPVDAAVRTVCEMADLGVIEDANVLVVTTRERAAARDKQDVDRKKARLLALTAANPGFCANNQVFVPNWLGGETPADLATTLTKLKEQNEQLKKQLDEVVKMLKK